MKKRIKDLTLEECQRICNKTSCGNCPLRRQHPDDNSILGCPVSFEDAYMLTEVEIDEINNDKH